MKYLNSVPAARLPAAMLLLSVALASGCASQQTTKEATPEPTAVTDADRTPMADTGATEAQQMQSDTAESLAKVIYFDYDHDDIKPQYRDAIAAHARYLRSHPQARLKLSGYADERGSREYNLALSERRVKAVLDQLMLSGIGEQRLSTAAFGEEYPAVKGHNEAAWSKNRRVEFDYQTDADGASQR